MLCTYLSKWQDIWTHGRRCWWLTLSTRSRQSDPVQRSSSLSCKRRSTLTLRPLRRSLRHPSSERSPASDWSTPRMGNSSSCRHPQLRTPPRIRATCRTHSRSREAAYRVEAFLPRPCCIPTTSTNLSSSRWSPPPPLQMPLRVPCCTKTSNRLLMGRTRRCTASEAFIRW